MVAPRALGPEIPPPPPPGSAAGAWAGFALKGTVGRLLHTRLARQLDSNSRSASAVWPKNSLVLTTMGAGSS